MSFFSSISLSFSGGRRYRRRGSRRGSGYYQAAGLVSEVVGAFLDHKESQKHGYYNNGGEANPYPYANNQGNVNITPLPARRTAADRGQPTRSRLPQRGGREVTGNQIAVPRCEQPRQQQYDYADEQQYGGYADEIQQQGSQRKQASSVQLPPRRGRTVEQSNQPSRSQSTQNQQTHKIPFTQKQADEKLPFVDDPFASVKCVKCGAGIPDGSKFCLNCGAFASESLPVFEVEEVEVFCPQCGGGLGQGAKFCQSCGTEIDWT